MLKGVQNFGKVASKANNLRQQQAKLQKLLKEIIVDGVSKNQKVKVRVNGEQKILDIYIDPSLVKFTQDNFFGIQTSDETQAQDMILKGQKFLSGPIIEAVDDAMSKVQSEIVKKMQESGSIGDLMSMLQAAGGEQ